MRVARGMVLKRDHHLMIAYFRLLVTNVSARTTEQELTKVSA